MRNLRIPGVLQRFGVAYFIVGLIQAVMAPEELPNLNYNSIMNENSVPWWWHFRDLKACLGQWLIMSIIIVLHTYLTLFLPVPGMSMSSRVTLEV